MAVLDSFSHFKDPVQNFIFIVRIYLVPTLLTSREHAHLLKVKLEMPKG